MIRQQLTYYKDYLERDNYKSFYLAFLRVAISFWLLKELVINWPSMDLLYGRSFFGEYKSNFINRLPWSILTIRDHYRWLIFPYLLIISLNILGIGRWFTALLLFGMVHVLQLMNGPFSTGGDIMARLILFYMIFANSYQYFVLVKRTYEDNEKRKLQNLFSNLAALSIMLQLCVAYFSAGVAKIMDPLWLHGQGTYYALSMERFMGTPLNSYLARHKWIDYLSNYGTILFELLFPVLIWFKKCRKPLLVAGVLFHLCIYIFLMIYSFQIVFLLMYGLFLPNQTLVDFAQRVKLFFVRKTKQQMLL